MSDDDDTQELPIIPTTYRLTARLETELQRFGQVLDGTPDELLFDLLITPRPRKLPVRWVDA